MSNEQPSDACLHRLGIAPGAELYRNALASSDDLAGWQAEGPCATTFPLGRMRLESTGAFEDGQKSNLVLWCPESFPERGRISWDFYPRNEPGLAILFFAAKGQGCQQIRE